MTWLDRLSLFTSLDILAVGLLFTVWLVLGYAIENPPKSRPSVTTLMGIYRQEWMRRMAERDNRIFDAQILANMRQATAFFGSASMIAIGGGLALIGNVEQFTGVASDLTLDMLPKFVWEAKVLLVLFFITNAFLKFVWSNRLFGYCSVLAAAVPNDPSDALTGPRVNQVAQINITAARSFNRGLRSVYFALGAAAWILGAVPLIIGTLITGAVLWRREFASHSRRALLDGV